MEERLGDTMMKGVNTVLGWWQLNVDAAESEEAGPPELTCPLGDDPDGIWTLALDLANYIGQERPRWVDPHDVVAPV